jgi:hypothetical protein
VAAVASAAAQLQDYKGNKNAARPYPTIDQTVVLFTPLLLQHRWVALLGVP